jgi:hypothetical protein
MPILVKLCRDCSLTFEALVLRKSDEDIITCPRCSSADLDWVPTAPRLIQFPNTKKFDMKRGRAHNPYENLTLSHVKDEFGKPIRVNSERELHEAEKKYNFIHWASHVTSHEELETPPMNESWAGDTRHTYDWKWTPPDRRDDKVGISVGAAAREDLLVDLPNSTKRVGT